MVDTSTIPLYFRRFPPHFQFPVVVYEVHFAGDRSLLLSFLPNFILSVEEKRFTAF